MSDLFYKIATLLSFLLIGIGSLLEAYKDNQGMISSLVGIAIVILVLMSICIIIYIYIQTQNDIIFKFNKKNKTLECINNSNHTMCISHTVYAPTSLSEQWRKGFRQKLDEEPKLNIIIPSGTKDIIFTSEESKAESSFTISYHFILPLPNDYCKSRTKIKIIKI